MSLHAVDLITSRDKIVTLTLSCLILLPSPLLSIVDVTGTRHPVCQVARVMGGLITTQVDTERADTGHQDQAPTTQGTQSVLGSAVAVKAGFQASNISNWSKKE